MKRCFILSLILVAVSGIHTYGDSPTDHSFLIGTWANIDQSSGGLAFFFIYEDQYRDLVIHTYGQCSPYCDWGIVPCIDYAGDPGSNLATGFMAFYDFGWKETWMAATRFDYPEWDILQVAHFHFYFDDPRYDFWMNEICIKLDL